jgi:N-acyl amino acid synthase of PEP-CTERM/exosortase system
MSRLVQQDAAYPQLKPAVFPVGAEPAKECLLEIYNRYFFSQAADTPELVARAQEIRYQVYCIEQQGYEDAAQHPDGREKDEFDTRSIHSLLVHRPSGVAMGTVRLVLPDGDAPDRSFAIQRAFEPSALTNGGFFPIATTAEVSRFSVSKAFRRRRGDGMFPGEDPDLAAGDAPAPRRSGPLMSLGLIQGLVRMSAQHGVTHWCAMMEPKLLRMLTTLGIYFEYIGEPVEYHGLRQPCYCAVDPMLQRVQQERPSYWDVLTDQGRIW